MVSMYSSRDNDAKSCLFCHFALSYSSVLHAEPGLFSRFYPVSFQSAKNRVKHGGPFGQAEGWKFDFLHDDRLLSLFNAVFGR